MNDFGERMKERGLRMTPARVVVFEVLLDVQGHRHLTVQEIYEQVAEKLPGLTPSTVYRTLETLHQAGLVDVMASPATEVRFSWRAPEHRHAHLVCRRCKATLDVDLSLVLDLAANIQAQSRFTVDVDHLTLTGMCSACQARRHDRVNPRAIGAAPSNNGTSWPVK
ncbi:MAG: Fur family transcriptional regulator [Candidatus Xenobia bacterium]